MMKRRMLASLVAISLLPAWGYGHAAPATIATQPHRVTFDDYSFLIDGKRIYLWSGEVHPYRLPSPTLWPDIFQKMKAAGFNTASIYFSWGYHSPREGEYDFTGVRDLDRLLNDARDAGIYVIARPGPYINAEVDSGGFPLWLTTKKVKNRSADPAYLKLADEWMTQIDRILARHQITDGRGSVIAYQVENEYYKRTGDGRAYMQHLEDKARADGITVPLVGNHNDTFVSGTGAVQVSGWDYYPQGFDCSHPEQWKPAPNMAQHKFAGEPLFTAEFQGGAFDPWGGPGYDKCADLINDRFANVFYKENIARGATAQNFYMLFGGTSWGWQAIPQNYTSYDYGAAITEARQFSAKYYEDKRIGYFLQSAAPILKTEASASARIDNSEIVDIARINPDTGTQFHLIRHGDSTATSIERAHLVLDTKEGHFDRVPQAPDTAITIDGRESKMLLADYDLGGARLIYSTSELMTNAAIGGRDIAILYGRHGTDGETTLAFASKPQVTVLSGDVSGQWANGQLRIDYKHDGLARVLIDGGARPLLLLLADTEATRSIWRQDTPKGAVLMLGGHLLRSARYEGDTLALTGDNDANPRAEIFAAAEPPVTWNGERLSTTTTPSNSMVTTLPIARTVALPALDHWQTRAGAPEIERSFDDSHWTIADKTTTASVTKPGSLPVLFADDYGFHTGNTWYRGHFSANARQSAPTGIYLKAKSGGPGGAFSVWLNGHFLGSITGNEERTFGFPWQYLAKGDNVVSVLTVNMGHEEDYDSTGENRTARGLIEAKPVGAPANAVAWRIQGATAPDKLRGPYNFGGLFGERQRWPLDPGRAADWKPATLPDSDPGAGVTWYRTDVTLDLPRDQDTSVGLDIIDQPSRHYRATIFVNGWQMGNYIAGMGPQHRFPIPNGVLDPNGRNTIVIAVWKPDASAGGLGKVSLVDFGSVTTPPRSAP